jgi:D-alanyl-D-alanine dipeptidase
MTSRVHWTYKDSATSMASALRPLLLTLLGTFSLAAQDIPPRPLEAPSSISPSVGTYVHRGDTLTILEDRGQLVLLGHEIGILALNPDAGNIRYVFGRDTLGFLGNSADVEWHGALYRRLDLGRMPFRVPLMRPLDELRREAESATPPTPIQASLQADLTDVAAADSTIRLDIRYATNENFLGSRVYTQARALLQRPAVEALVRSHRWLARFGYGVLVHDAYRPWSITKIFWEATPPAQREFVANPATGSKHNRGCAVDVTLYDLRTGRTAEMPSTYDEFSFRAYADYPGGTSLQRWHRTLLRRALEREGFIQEHVEWWHFDYCDWQRYPVLNIPFEGIH